MRALGLDPDLSDTASGHRDLPPSFHFAPDTPTRNMQGKVLGTFLPPPADKVPSHIRF